MGVLAPALRWNRGNRAFEDLEESLLDTLAGDVTGDGGVLRLARHLVDLVDIDDSLLCPGHVVIGGLKQLEEDVLHILTDVAGLGEAGRVCDGKRDVQLPGKRLSEERLSTPGRANEEDVRLLELDISLEIARANPLVVVVHRHRELFLGVFLANHVVVEVRLDLCRLRKLGERHLFSRRELFGDDLVAEIDALVAYVDARACDEFLDLLLRLTAEAAFQQLSAITKTCHV